MAEMATPRKPKPLLRFFGFFIALGKDGINWLTEKTPNAKEWLNKEGRGLKDGWVFLVIVCALVAAGVAYGVNHFWTGYHQSELKEQKDSLTSAHSSELHTKQMEFEELRKKDRADFNQVLERREGTITELRADLQRFKTVDEIGNRFFSNAPPDTRIDLLVSMVTNALDPNRFKFSLFVNNAQILSERQLVELTEERTITVNVRNDSAQSVKNITVAINLGVARTNVVLDWQQQGGKFNITNGGLQKIEGVLTFSYDSHRSIPPNNLFTTSPIRFTNLTRRVFGATVEVHAPDGKEQKFPLMILEPGNP